MSDCLHSILSFCKMGIIRILISWCDRLLHKIMHVKDLSQCLVQSNCLVKVIIVSFSSLLIRGATLVSTVSPGLSLYLQLCTLCWAFQELQGEVEEWGRQGREGSLAAFWDSLAQAPPGASKRALS